VRGQIVTLSGYVRAADFRGRAGFYAVVHGPAYGVSLASEFKSDSLPHTTGWQPVQLQIPVGATATEVVIGFQINGIGQLWLDNVRVRTAQRPYHDAPLPGTEPLLTTAAPTPTDWDFERLPTVGADAPYSLTLNSDAPHHGQRSLRVTTAAAGPAAGAFILLGTLQVDSALWNKKLTIKGYVRRSAVGPAVGWYAAPLWGTLATDLQKRATGNTRQQLTETVVAPATSAGWQPFTMTVSLPGNAEVRQQLALGLHVAGAGIVDLDDISFALDGRDYAPAQLTVPAPTAAEIAWLRAHAVPLTSALPTTAVNADLQALGKLIGNARLVGVGNITYGSREVLQLQHRLLRYLVQEKGFTGLVLEADLAACLPLDDYVQTGQGDPAKLLAGLTPWNKQEVLAAVQWLRAYRQQHPNAPVHVLGLDMQHPGAALAALRATTDAKDPFVRTQLPVLEQRLTELARQEPRVNPFEANYQKPAARQAVDQLLTELREHFEAGAHLRATDLQLAARRLHYLRLLEQYSAWLTLPLAFADAHHSACLAENLRWLTQQQPGQKLVLWAHNEVVSTGGSATSSPAGTWLRATFGSAYVALGTAFYQGTFMATAGSTSATATAQSAYPGTYEQYFHAARLALALLPLQALKLTPDNAWLFQNLDFRDVEQADTRYQFNSHGLRGAFDAVLFMEKSSAAAVLP